MSVPNTPGSKENTEKAFSEVSELLGMSHPRDRKGSNASNFTAWFFDTWEVGIPISICNLLPKGDGITLDAYRNVTSI